MIMMRMRHENSLEVAIQVLAESPNIVEELLVRFDARVDHEPARAKAAGVHVGAAQHAEVGVLARNQVHRVTII